jgi:hypothetical protein
MYVEGNPINNVDPSGNKPRPPHHNPPNYYCRTYDDRLATAEYYVSNRGNELNTFTAAGIAVQCSGLLGDAAATYYDGRGIAQISEGQASTGYGEDVYDGGNRFDHERHFRGTGVLCYVLKESAALENIPCLFCNTRKELEKLLGDGQKFDDVFDLEKKHDPTNPRWAVEYMRRRIKQVVDLCTPDFCEAKDRVIVAALAQNGPGFTTKDMRDLRGFLLPSDGGRKKVDWKEWYAERSPASKDEYRKQWNLFYKFSRDLYRDGYWLPDASVFGDDDTRWLLSQ